MKAADQFHVGVVVHDLDAALTELSALFGYEWCPQLAVSTPVVLPDGEATLDLVFTLLQDRTASRGDPDHAGNALGFRLRVRASTTSATGPTTSLRMPRF